MCIRDRYNSEFLDCRRISTVARNLLIFCKIELRVFSLSSFVLWGKFLELLKNLFKSTIESFSKEVSISIFFTYTIIIITRTDVIIVSLFSLLTFFPILHRSTPRPSQNVSWHSVTIKKLSVPGEPPTQCDSWRHTKQPYVGRFFISHQDREILDSKSFKVSLFLYYFFICCDFNENFWNLYHK